MSKVIKKLEDIQIPDSYVLKKSEWIPELESFALVFSHKVSGARVLALSNEDDNKVFSIGFRTPPKNSTGVPHIIEHTVLCGSKQFPAKDPFVELVKGSLNTFLNATTYPDKTLYPVASCNEKDFKNLMHVYMDAVFYPNIYQYEEIFKQEGWHYELDDPEGELTYNGVVYNEMKGVFSSEDSVLERFLMNSMFPDNTYGVESGGDPRDIPSLTYEEYLDFHRQYYHPVNSYIYLYGNMDIAERLAWMDENYLSEFPAIKIDSTIPLQKPFSKIQKLSKEYAVSEEEDVSEKNYYAFGVVMDITLDTNACKAMELLSYVLAEQPGAPLKQAILDAGLGTDVDADFCDILRQSTFTLSTKNAKPGKKEEFYQIIRSTLEDIVAHGVNRKDLEAAINGTEFREREADFGAYPKGLLYGMKLMKTWLYDDDMVYDALKYEESYQFLREQLSTDYYENLIRKYLIDNTHAVLIEMVPKKGLAAEVEEATRQELAAYKASLSDEEIQKIIDDTKALKAYQEEPTPKEILEMIPMLEREDIEKKVQPFYNTEKEYQNIKVLHHNVHTNDIVYLRLLFDADEFQNYMPQVSFLGTLLGYMDTEQRGYREFDTETNFYTGGINSDIHIVTVKNQSDVFKMYFQVQVKVLRSQLSHALSLLAEMMFETKFDDEKHLREVIAETRSRLKVRLMSSGHTACAARALAKHTKVAWLNDASVGIEYYNYLKRLDENFDEEKTSVIEGCRQMVQTLFSRKKMMISVTGNEKDYSALESNLPEFLAKLDAFEAKETKTDLSVMEEIVPNLSKKNEAFATPGEIQFVAVAGRFDRLDQVNHGALKVVRHLLNYEYLWNEVRVKGGAYGVSCRFNNDKDGFFTSYRDPGLGSTLDVYHHAAQYLQNYEADEREVTKTIIGTISGLDVPLTPAMKGTRSLTAYLTEIPYEELQKERDQILHCTVEDIRKTAQVIQEIMETGTVCVLGNEKRLTEEKERFDSMIVLS